MPNLLEETRYKIEFNGKAPEDIHFIGSSDGNYSCTWEEFQKIADVEYDAGFGAQEIATDLIIQFNDRTYLQREEYDGSESWSYVTLMPLYSRGLPFTKVSGGMWRSIQELNGLTNE